MADLTRTIEIIFGAVDSGVTATTSALDKALGGLESSVPAVAGVLGDVADKALAAEAGILALATAYGGLALKTASEFQSAQVTLGRILGDSPAQVQAVSDQVEALALQYGKSSTTVFQFATDFLQAGFSAEEAGKLTKSALDLMVAGDVDATQATQTIIGTLKGFGAAVSDIPSILDGLNSVVDGTATNLAQLSEGMAIAAPVAKTLGFNWAETTAILTPIIEIFQSGSEAGTAFATAMGRLIDDSKPVQDALKALGVTQTDFNGQLRSGRDIFFDVQKAFQNLDDSQKLFYANQLVGVEQGKRLVLAFGDLNKTQEILNITQQSSGSIAKEVGLQLQTMEAQAARVSEAFRQMNAAVGSELAKNIGGVSGSIVDLEVAFKKVVESGGLAPLFEAIDAQALKIGETLATVARNLPEAFAQVDFSGLLRSFENLGDSLGGIFSGIFGEIDVSTPEGLAEALQKLVDAFTALNNVTSGILDELRPVFEAFGELINQSGAAGEEAQIMAGQFLGAMKLINDFGVAFGTLAVLLEESRASIENVADVVGGVLIVAINAAQAAFDGFAFLVVGAAKGILEALEAITPDFLGDPFRDKAAELDAVLTGIKDNLDRNASEMVGGFGKIGEGLGLVSDSAKEAKTPLDQVGESGKQAVEATKGFEPIDLGDVDFVAEGMKRLGISAKGAASATGEVADAQDRLASATKTEQLATGYIKFTDALGNVHYAFATAEEKAVGYKKIVDELGNVTYVQVGGAIEKVNNALSTHTSKMDEATKKSEEFQLKLREIESKETIAFIEAKFKFDAEALKSDTECVKAAFESINTSIKSTGDTLSDLTGSLTKADDRWTESTIEDLIKNEEKRRDAAFSLQKQLTEQQIQYLKARTAKIAGGAPLIQVEATNLKPALEMIWVEIMRYAQVRANEEGLELLLGGTA